jgi:hypothetical protein
MRSSELHGALAATGTFGAGALGAEAAAAGVGAAAGVAGDAAGLVTKVALGVAVAGVSLVIVSSGGGCDTPLYEVGFCVLCARRQSEQAATPAIKTIAIRRFLMLTYTPCSNNANAGN